MLHKALVAQIRFIEGLHTLCLLFKGKYLVDTLLAIFCADLEPATGVLVLGGEHLQIVHLIAYFE